MLPFTDFRVELRVFSNFVDFLCDTYFVMRTHSVDSSSKRRSLREKIISSENETLLEVKQVNACLGIP